MGEEAGEEVAEVVAAEVAALADEEKLRYGSGRSVGWSRPREVGRVEAEEEAEEEQLGWACGQVGEGWWAED